MVHVRVLEAYPRLIAGCVLVVGNRLDMTLGVDIVLECILTMGK